MNKFKAAGWVLIVLGVVALVVGRVSYLTQKNLVTIGPYQTQMETRRVIPMRMLGAVTVAAGVALVALHKKL